MTLYLHNQDLSAREALDSFAKRIRKKDSSLVTHLVLHFLKNSKAAKAQKINAFFHLLLH